MSLFAKGPACRTSILGHRKLQTERNTWLNLLNITCDIYHALQNDIRSGIKVAKSPKKLGKAKLSSNG